MNESIFRNIRPNSRIKSPVSKKDDFYSSFGMRDFYFPADNVSAFKFAGYTLKCVPSTKIYSNISVDLVQNFILEQQFTEIYNTSNFDKETASNSRHSAFFVNSTLNAVVYISCDDEDNYDFDNKDFLSKLSSDDSGNKKNSKLCCVYLFYPIQNAGAKWDAFIKGIEKINLTTFKLTVKKNSINFLCFDSYYRLKNLKVNRKIQANLELNYGASFTKIHDHLLKFLESDQTGITILNGMPGTGKCLGKGTPVIMFDGSIKKVEDIIVGDLLMGPDSKPRNVLSLASGSDEMYKVIPTKGTPYIVNKPHILSLKESGTKKCGEIKNMSVEDFLNLKNYQKNTLKTWRTGVEFPTKEVPLDPYFLGVWLGDGTATQPSITTMDSEIVDYCETLAKKLNMVLYTEKQGSTGKARTYSIRDTYRIKKGEPRCHNKIMMALRYVNLLGNKHIPNCYLTNNRDIRLKVLAGLLDTDGYYSDGCFEITTVKERLSDEILFLARSLGFAANCKKRTVRCRVGKYDDFCTSYRIVISGELTAIPTLVKRKIAKPRKQIKNVLVSGLKVESLGLGDYYGFEIDRDGLFLLGDFTVTHNTSYLKYLLSILNKKVIYIPPNLVSRIADPDFLSFMLTQNDFILVIEDAESVVKNREITGNTSGVSNLLNLSDGILGECIKTKIIVTFNCNIDDIDPALTRKGRLKLQYEFKKLSVEDSNKLLSHLKINHVTKEPMALGDIYGFDEENFKKEKQKQIIGFNPK